VEEGAQLCDGQLGRKASRLLPWRPTCEPWRGAGRRSSSHVARRVLEDFSKNSRLDSKKPRNIGRFRFNPLQIEGSILLDEPGTEARPPPANFAFWGTWGC